MIHDHDTAPYLETRTIEHGDGRVEIARIIDRENLEGWSKDHPLAFEESVIWLEPVAHMPFVRVALIANSRSRRGRLDLEGERRRVVGYVKLTPDAPRFGGDRYYRRRIFYVKDMDPISRDELARASTVPLGAVVPRTVFPTLWGVAPLATPHSPLPR